MGIDKTQVKFPIFNFQSPTYKQQKWWFWAAIFVGLAIRIYLVIFTEGTTDVAAWQSHAAGVLEKGLIGYYHANGEMNHPPFISIIISWLLKLSGASGIPFRILLRAPFAMLDAGTAILLMYCFCASPYRFLIAAGYWLHPLAMIFSAYHGNTDSSVAFFLMLCVYLLSKEKTALAGAILGISLWIKLPGILAAPAIVFFLPNWRQRLNFLLTADIVGISTYLPALFSDPAVIFKNVFGYEGRIVATTEWTFIWGPQIFIVPFFDSLTLQQQIRFDSLVLFVLNQSAWLAIGLLLIFSWIRRSKRTTQQLGTTIATAYIILYGFSNSWSFQYLAWSIPFWFFAPVLFSSAATVLTSIYIYSLYWLLCGNPFLLGKWDFMGHPHWPGFIEIFRNIAWLFFFFSALVFLITGLYSEAARIYNRKKQ